MQKIDIAEFNEELDKLGFPEEKRKKIMRLISQVNNISIYINVAIAQLQDSIDYLRFHIKYLIFDLEATRRENALLRKENAELRVWLKKYLSDEESGG